MKQNYNLEVLLNNKEYFEKQKKRQIVSYENSRKFSMLLKNKMYKTYFKEVDSKKVEYYPLSYLRNQKKFEKDSSEERENQKIKELENMMTVKKYNENNTSLVEENIKTKQNFFITHVNDASLERKEFLKKKFDMDHKILTFYRIYENDEYSDYYNTLNFVSFTKNKKKPPLKNFISNKGKNKYSHSIHKRCVNEEFNKAKEFFKISEPKKTPKEIENDEDFLNELSRKHKEAQKNKQYKTIYSNGFNTNNYVEENSVVHPKTMHKNDIEVGLKIDYVNLGKNPNPSSTSIVNLKKDKITVNSPISISDRSNNNSIVDNQFNDKKLIVAIKQKKIEDTKEDICINIMPKNYDNHFKKELKTKNYSSTITDFYNRNELPDNLVINQNVINIDNGKKSYKIKEARKNKALYPCLTFYKECQKMNIDNFLKSNEGVNMVKAKQKNMSNFKLKTQKDNYKIDKTDFFDDLVVKPGDAAPLNKLSEMKKKMLKSPLNKRDIIWEESIKRKQDKINKKMSKLKDKKIEQIYNSIIN